MASSKQMKMLDAKLAQIAAEIDRLRAQQEVLLYLKKEMAGEDPAPVARKRSPNVKPLVIDIMAEVGEQGATTAEVDTMVRIKIPTVANDTVGSILSRLKADGALVYDGERYYEKRFAPAPRPFDGGLRAVN